MQNGAHLVKHENVVKRICSCKISFGYSRERARQKNAKNIKFLTAIICNKKLKHPLVARPRVQPSRGPLGAALRPEEQAHLSARRDRDQSFSARDPYFFVGDL